LLGRAVAVLMLVVARAKGLGVRCEEGVDLVVAVERVVARVEGAAFALVAGRVVGRGVCELVAVGVPRYGRPWWSHGARSRLSGMSSERWDGWAEEGRLAGWPGAG